MHGPRERVIVISPTHRLGNRHRLDRIGKDVLQQRCRGRARLHVARDETLALRIGRAFELRDIEPVLLRKTFQRGRRFAFRIERDIEIGTEAFAALFGLFGRDLRQQHREASRRVQRFRVAAFDRDAAFLEACQYAIEQRLRKFGQRLDRQLFGADFDQQGCSRAHADCA